MMKSKTNSLMSMVALLLLASMLIVLSAHQVTAANPAIPSAPVIDGHARVKEHRGGARGDLVAGEEDLRKIIVQWDKVYDAVEYEVCHDCVDETTGGSSVVDVTKGTLSHVSAGGAAGTCGGRPCHIVKGCPFGINTFHVRAKIQFQGGGNAFTEWSEPRNYNVQEEAGHVDHEEL